MRGENHTINDYDIGQLLGRGGFATVYRARERTTGHVFALKIMEKSYISKHKMEIRVQNEIRIQSELTSRGIVKLYRHFEDADYVYMVLELCEGGNLYKYLKTHGPLSEMEARSIIRQLLVALEYMHGLGVVHRDLKLSNVLLVSSSPESSMAGDSVVDFMVKLCDFGLAVQVEHPDEVSNTYSHRTHLFSARYPSFRVRL
jgi:polo-like kinase 4